ncbi:MAG: hypothetical protein NC548_39845 [Lachnospiraceae bacterium]|nr:hypothetical protein [Lachnospiraceae bacterium]
MNDQVYIHYGATKFDPTKNFPISNEPHWVKPRGGTWASRVNAGFGWKDWNESEEFIECNPDNSFQFTIKEGANIAFIKTTADLQKLPVQNESKWNADHPWSRYLIDFEKCLELGIDGIELCIYGDEYEGADYFPIHYALYGWDCDSIVILNPDVVVPLEV